MVKRTSAPKVRRHKRIVSKKLRFEVFTRDGFTCQYCGRKAPSVILNADHRTPVSKGGVSSLANLVTACLDCNGGKSDREVLGNTEFETLAIQMGDVTLAPYLEAQTIVRQAIQDRNYHCLDVLREAHSVGLSLSWISLHVKMYCSTRLSFERFMDSIIETRLFSGRAPR